MAGSTGIAGPWTAEYHEAPNGSSPFETWMDTLSESKVAALIASIEYALEPNGLNLVGTPWLTHVEKGIYEFRIRYLAADIKAMYAQANLDGPTTPEKILLRVFVHFHGAKAILLMHGYDKAADDKPSRQQTEINVAKSRLTQWRLNEAKKAKTAKRTSNAVKPASRQGKR